MMVIDMNDDGDMNDEKDPLLGKEFAHQTAKKILSLHPHTTAGNLAV